MSMESSETGYVFFRYVTKSGLDTIIKKIPDVVVIPHPVPVIKYYGDNLRAYKFIGNKQKLISHFETGVLNSYDEPDWLDSYIFFINSFYDQVHYITNGDKIKLISYFYDNIIKTPEDIVKLSIENVNLIERGFLTRYLLNSKRWLDWFSQRITRRLSNSNVYSAMLDKFEYRIESNLDFKMLSQYVLRDFWLYGHSSNKKKSVSNITIFLDEIASELEPFVNNNTLENIEEMSTIFSKLRRIKLKFPNAINNHKRIRSILIKLSRNIVGEFKTLSNNLKNGSIDVTKFLRLQDDLLVEMIKISAYIVPNYKLVVNSFLRQLFDSIISNAGEFQKTNAAVLNTIVNRYSEHLGDFKDEQKLL